jgi:hypothetical protein
MKRSTPDHSVTFVSSQRKTFHSALCRLLQTDFPGHFGPKVAHLFAEEVEQLFDEFHPERSRVSIGQVVWAAVAIDDRPARNKRIEDTRLLPIVLDLVTPHDIDETVRPGRRLPTRRAKIVRLFQQAHQQGAVLGYPDVALLLHISTGAVSKAVLAYERETGNSVPRRGTIHDMGPSVSHKAIICYKSFVEGKTTSQIAQETFHCPEEVEYYLQCFRRVRICKDRGMSPEETAQATAHSEPLVRQYLDLIARFDVPPSEQPNATPPQQEVNVSTVPVK